MPLQVDPIGGNTHEELGPKPALGNGTLTSRAMQNLCLCHRGGGDSNTSAPGVWGGCIGQMPVDKLGRKCHGGVAQPENGKEMLGTALGQGPIDGVGTRIYALGSHWQQGTSSPNTSVGNQISLLRGRNPTPWDGQPPCCGAKLGSGQTGFWGTTIDTPPVSQNGLILHGNSPAETSG